MNDTLSYLVQLAFFALVAASIFELVRQRDAQHLQIALLMISVALVVWVLTGTNYQLPQWVLLGGSMAAAAQPFLLLRLVQNIQATPPFTQWLALGGMLTVAGLLLVVPTPRPAWFIWLGVTYFVAVDGYAGYVLARAAQRAQGVTRQRSFFAAVGSFCLALLVLAAGWYLVTREVALQPVLVPFALLFLFLLALSYYLGFSPPRALRRQWQESALLAFLRGMAGYTMNVRAAMALSNVCDAAIHAVDARDAQVVVWKEDERVFTVLAPNEGTGFGIENRALESAWRTLVPFLARTRAEMGHELAEYADKLGANALIVIPLITSKASMGLLLVWLRSIPFFVEDDVRLLSLLAKETATALDHGVLHSELEERVAQRTAELEATNANLQQEILERERAQQALRDSEAHFRALLEHSFDVVTLFDGQGGILYSTPGTTRVLGYRVQEYVGRNIFEYVHPDDIPDAQAALARVLKTPGEIVNVEFRLLCQDGAWAFVEGVVKNLLHEPSVRAIVGNYRDVTERNRTQDLLREKNVQLQNWVKVLQHHNDESRELNAFGEDLQTCYDLPEVLHLIENYAPRLFPNFRGSIGIVDETQKVLRWAAHWGEPQANGHHSVTMEECLALRRGRSYVVTDSNTQELCQHLSPVPSSYVCIPLAAQDEIFGLLHIAAFPPETLSDSEQRIARSISSQVELALANMRLREFLREQAIHDALTGLYNRRYLEEVLEREAYTAARMAQRIGIIMLDLDHFKNLNDSFGHDAGDAVLRAIGQFLTQQIRQGDIACRYGGEEFALFLPNAPLQVVGERAEGLRLGVQALDVQYRDTSLPKMTISLGVAALPEHGATGLDALRAADEALYRAKRAGRNRVVVANEN